MKPVLAIGDTHGHLDRLEALLMQEGIIGPCGMCGSSGDVGEADKAIFCPACEGIGTVRLHNDAIVVHLGDLGDYSSKGSPTGDELCWHYGKRWIDIQLWGNHDRAVFDQWHAFTNYQAPGPTVKHLMRQRINDGTLLLAYAAHGFLLTHAGLHPKFKHQRVDPALKEDPRAFADWINQYSNPDLPIDETAQGVRDAISGYRGGRSTAGGILWRDAGESLYPFRQVFGHSAKRKVRMYMAKTGSSYCIDTGKDSNNRLAGIWLPEERIATVNLTLMSDARTSQVHSQNTDPRPAREPAQGSGADLASVDQG